MTTSTDIRDIGGPAESVEAILADSILDYLAGLESVSDSLHMDADELWEMVETGDVAAIYRAGMILKGSIDDEPGLLYADRLRLALLANAITYAALERF